MLARTLAQLGEHAEAARATAEEIELITDSFLKGMALIRLAEMHRKAGAHADALRALGSAGVIRGDGPDRSLAEEYHLLAAVAEPDIATVADAEERRLAALDSADD